MNYINIDILNEYPVRDMRLRALNTLGKELDDNKLSEKAIKNYLISEHSVIRDIIIEVYLNNISYYTSVHFIRSDKFFNHNFSINHSVKSNREDITGKERTVNDKVNHMFTGNPKGFIDMMRTRLCYKCSKDTLHIAKQIKKSFMNNGNTNKEKRKLLKVLGEVLVPNCVYRCGCPEFKSCGFFNSINLSNIDNRYQQYNKNFNKD